MLILRFTVKRVRGTVKGKHLLAANYPDPEITWLVCAWSKQFLQIYLSKLQPDSHESAAYTTNLIADWYSIVFFLWSLLSTNCKGLSAAWSAVPSRPCSTVEDFLVDGQTRLTVMKEIEGLSKGIGHLANQTLSTNLTTCDLFPSNFHRTCPKLVQTPWIVFL